MACHDSVESQRGCCGKTSLRFGVAYIIFLNKMHEKEIATRTQKNLSFGVTVYAGLAGAVIGIFQIMTYAGVSSEIVEQVFEETDYGEEDSRQAIEALMRKRNYNPETADAKEKQKMMGYLMRKGFSYQDVRNVLQVCE